MLSLDVPGFHELDPQDVREYWRDEARQFTPWLANSIRSEDASHLEDVIGLDLAVIETEKSVFLNVIRALFGGDESPATSSTSVQYLANERWGAARLVNTALNIRNDWGWSPRRDQRRATRYEGGSRPSTSWSLQARRRDMDTKVALLQLLIIKQ
jgi:hypothetical protein